MNLEKSISNLSQRLDKLSPDIINDVNLNDGIRFWRGKKIIPLNQWFQIKKDYGLKAALQFFPDEYPPFGLPCTVEGIEDAKLKEVADKWYSEYKDLMEFRRNPTYGHEKCFRCLLSPAREQSKLFFGIDKIIARELERRCNISSSPTSPSIYPCPVLNIFECPYAKKENKEEEGEDGNTFDTRDLFDLSEIAFRLELALRKAQVMTKSNDTIYEADFENGKVRDTGYYSHHFLSTDGPLEEKLAEVKRLSKVPIRNVEDMYQALTKRQPLDNVLDQGLDQEYQKHKDDLVNFFMSIKDSIRKEDLFNAQNSDVSSSDANRIQKQYVKCSICQGFANIHCINCNNVWLCIDHWKHHQGDKHSSDRILKDDRRNSRSPGFLDRM